MGSHAVYADQQKEGLSLNGFIFARVTWGKKDTGFTLAHFSADQIYLFCCMMS